MSFLILYCEHRCVSTIRIILLCTYYEITPKLGDRIYLTIDSFCNDLFCVLIVTVGGAGEEIFNVLELENTRCNKMKVLEALLHRRNVFYISTESHFSIV